ncbi:hypothetical protein FHS96_000914 [Sphingomonas zeicaulis]
MSKSSEENDQFLPIGPPSEPSARPSLSQEQIDRDRAFASYESSCIVLKMPLPLFRN